MKHKILWGLISALSLVLPHQLHAQVPIASFALSPTVACAGSTVQVTDLSSGLPTAWSYTLGGIPANSTQQNPVVSFDAPGIYTISLSAANLDGESAVFTQTIEINGLPQLTLSGSSELCAGGIATQTVGGADSYSWSSGSATDTETFSPLSGGTYSVIGTNTLTGCSATQTLIITVNPLPVLAASGGTSVCAGGSLIQTLGGADTYTWNTEAVTGNTVSISPTGNTSYTLSGTNTLTGCQNSVAISIIVSPLPSVIISGGNTVCAGSALALTASGADTYLWSTAETDAGIMVSPTVNTNYSVTGTSTLTGCSNSAAVSVTASSLPTLAISGNAAYCVSGTASLTVTGADSYLWSTGNATDTETFSPTVTSSYSVTGTSTLTGCSITVPVTVTVNSLPLLTVNGATAICAGENTSLIFGGASSYTWNGLANADGSVSINPGTTTGYTLEGSDNSTGCTNSLQVTVVVNSLPAIAIAGSSSVCAGSSLVLTASGADEYLWSDGSATDVATFMPTTDMTYTVTGTNTLSGCSGTAAVSVTAVALPTLNVTGNSAYCVTGVASLTVSGADSYLWSSGSAVDTETFSPGATTIYSVTGTNTLTGCSAVQPVTITVNSLPALSVNGATAICIGGATTLTFVGADSYTWNGTASVNGSVNLNPASTSSYTLEGLNSTTGCSNTLEVTVTVNSLPSISISGNSTVCSSAAVVLTAGGADSYLWSDGSATDAATFSPVSTTEYTVTGTNTLTGCSNTAVATVTTIALPALSLSGDNAFCAGGSVTQTVSGADSYIWSSGSTTDNETFSPGSTTIYSVSGTSTLTGCTGNSTLQITVNPLPLLGISGNGSVCIGSAITPSLTGANSYTWNSSAVFGNTVSLNPTVNTTYTLEGTISATGCYNSTLISIAVNNLPVISISGDATVCAGSAILQTASGADSYLWDDGTATDAATFYPASNSVYTVTGTNTLTGCSDMATVSVTAIALPNLVLSGTNSYCQGGSATQTVSGADTYSWSTGATLDNETFNPVASTVYSVTGTSTVTGCSATLPVSITVNLIPTITVNSGSVCAGDVFTMNPGGASTYTYSNGSNTVIPVSNTSYTVTGTSAEGCVASNSAVASVTVNSRPTVSINNATLCAGSSLTIQPSGASVYTVQGGVITVTPMTSTSYTIAGSSQEGCLSTNIATLLVTVNALPTLAINGNAAVCAGSAANLTITGATNYTWSTGATTNSISETPVVNTTYTAIGVDANGCANTAAREVTVNAVPVVTVSGGTICQGSSFVLSPGGAGSYTYSSGSATVSPNSTTNYTVTGSSAAGCISQNAVATVSVVNALTLTVSGDLSICTGLGTTLTASGASSYSWSTGANVAMITPTPVMNSAYTVTGTTGPCTSMTTVAVSVNALPNYSASSSSSVVCVGETVTLTVTGPGTYTWSTMETSSSITVSPTSNTTYTVGGMDANGCVNATAITQTVDACTGITEYSSGLNFGLYPNPNNGSFHLQVDRHVTVMVVNSLGQQVFNTTLNEGQHNIELRELTKGLYFVTVSSGNRSQTVKMLVD